MSQANQIMRHFSPDGETTFDIQDARTGKSDYTVFNYNYNPAQSYTTEVSETIVDEVQIQHLKDAGRCFIRMSGDTKNSGTVINHMTSYTIYGRFTDDGQGGYIFSPENNMGENIHNIILTVNDASDAKLVINFDERKVDSVELTYFMLHTYQSVQNTWDISLIPVEDIYRKIVARLEEDGYIQSQLQI